MVNTVCMSDLEFYEISLLFQPTTDSALSELMLKLKAQDPTLDFVFAKCDGILFLNVCKNVTVNSHLFLKFGPEYTTVTEYHFQYSLLYV